MDSTRFDSFFNWMVVWEGGDFEDVEGDTGGETRWGIDKASHPTVDIRNLTRSGAKAIYRVEYWGAVRADILPAPLDWIVTDIAVNNGKSRAVKWLQEAVGVVPDGSFGPKTLKALEEHGVGPVRAYLLNRREEFYKHIAVGNKEKFLKGWLNRNNDLKRVTAS